MGDRLRSSGLTRHLTVPEFRAGLGSDGWTAYTPTLSSGGTQGNAVMTGRRVLIGMTVHFYAKMVLGTTSAISSTPTLSLPFTAAANGVPQANAMLNDVGANFYFASGYISGSGVTIFTRGTNGAALNTTSTVPFTWVTGDSIEVHGTYERA